MRRPNHPTTSVTPEHAHVSPCSRGFGVRDALQGFVMTKYKAAAACGRMQTCSILSALRKHIGTISHGPPTPGAASGNFWCVAREPIPNI